MRSKRSQPGVRDGRFIGYEDKHYELSMRIGELVLFPAVRETEAGVVAPGTSCRHQIMDGTGREASHPAIWLKDALM